MPDFNPSSRRFLGAAGALAALFGGSLMLFASRRKKRRRDALEDESESACAILHETVAFLKDEQDDDDPAALPSPDFAEDAPALAEPAMAGISAPVEEPEAIDPPLLMTSEEETYEEDSEEEFEETEPAFATISENGHHSESSNGYAKETAIEPLEEPSFDSGLLKPLESIQLGESGSLHLVSALGKLYLIGVTPQQVSLLKEIEPSDASGGKGIAALFEHLARPLPRDN
jgi:hypothetical protein